MADSWRDLLRADPIPWLIEPENPAVRYATLRNLLDRPADDPEMLTSQVAIPDYPPLAELLANQKPDGFWVKRDYYLPKHSGTLGVLCVLGDLGLAAKHPQIQHSCDLVGDTGSVKDAQSAAGHSTWRGPDRLRGRQSVMQKRVEW